MAQGTIVTRTGRLFTVVLPLVLLLTLGQEARAQDAQYTVTTIVGITAPTAMNDSGNVVGYAMAADGHFHAYLWSQGVTTDLGTMGGSDAIAMAINDSGQIAGNVVTSDGVDHFIYTNGSVLNIGLPEQNFPSFGINSRGDIASYTNLTTAFLYTYSTGVVQFLPVPGCSTGGAADVNDSEVITGSASGGACGSQLGVVWSGGNFQILPSEPGTTDRTQPTKINAGGQIVGFDDAPSARPVIWQPNNAGGYTLLDLGLPTGADAAGGIWINNLGVAVGELDGSYGAHGFVWYSTNGIRDVNSLVPVGSVALGAAVAINDSGAILGMLADRSAAYLLTPTPVCTVTYSGTVRGNLTISSGTTCITDGNVTGNVTQSGGRLIASNATISGNLNITGGSTFSIGDSSTIYGNLQIQNIPAGAAQNQICGATVKGNLQFQNDGTAVQIGSASPSSCAGNVIGGNLTVQNNSASTALYDNTVGGNLQDQNNTAPTQIDGNSVGGNLQAQNNSASTQVFGDTVKSNLQCQNNSSITGGDDTARSIQGQCITF